MPRPTLRTLARELGLSRTTVSDALRGSPRVNAGTQARVRAAAAAAGYQRNPLTGEVMSQLRRSNSQSVRGTLAALEVTTHPASAPTTAYATAILRGAEQRAQELGFRIEFFPTGGDDARLRRVDGILHARGIRGVIVLPGAARLDLGGLTWSRLTGVQTDAQVEPSGLAGVAPDYFRSLTTALRAARDRGFTRPGLFLGGDNDELSLCRWEGAFLALQGLMPSLKRLPVLRGGAVSRTAFANWLRRHEPDVVLSDVPDSLEWMRSAGCVIPDQHGFIQLNASPNLGFAAGLDLQPARIGARAAELVIEQIIQNESGLPSAPALTLLPALWSEGPTLRLERAASDTAVREPEAVFAK